MRRKQGLAYWSFGQFLVEGILEPKDYAELQQYDYDNNDGFSLSPFGISIHIADEDFTEENYEEIFHCKVELRINEPLVHSDKLKLLEHVIKTPLHQIGIFSPDTSFGLDEVEDTPDDVSLTKISSDQVRLTVFTLAIREYVIYIDEL